MAPKNIITLVSTLVLAAAFSISCDRVMDPGESITIDTTGRSGAGINVSPITGLITSENHDTAQFQVVLTSKPSSDVMVPVSSGAIKEGAIMLGTLYREQVILTFTAADWNVAQTVIISGVDELDLSGTPLQDGDTPYVISLDEAISEDADYNGINPSNVLITNMDNDSPGIIILSNTKSLVTNEGGLTCQIRFKLRMPPANNASVTIGSITTSDSSEGVVSSGNSITISSYSWNMEQIVTIAGQPDDGDTAAQSYTIDFGTFSSTDTTYNGVAAGSVDVVNLEYIGAMQYTRSSDTSPFSSISTTGMAITFNKNSDYYSAEENGYAYVPIGFTFNYLGVDLTQILVTTEGMASFDPAFTKYSTTDYNDYLYSYLTYPTRFVLAPWWDNFSTAGETVYYEVQGSSPNRVLVIEWNDLHYQYINYFTFQLVLHETTGIIEFVYGPSRAEGTPIDNYASAGINDGTGGYTDLGDAYANRIDLKLSDFPVEGTTYSFTPAW